MKKGISLIETVVAVAMSAVVLMLISNVLRTYVTMQDKAITYAKQTNDIASVKDLVLDTFDDTKVSFNYYLDTGEKLGAKLETINTEEITDEVLLERIGNLIKFCEILSNPDKWFTYQDSKLSFVNEELLSIIQPISIKDDFEVNDLLFKKSDGSDIDTSVHYVEKTNGLPYSSMEIIFRDNNTGFKYCRIKYKLYGDELSTKFVLGQGTIFSAETINLAETDPNKEYTEEEIQSKKVFNYDLITSYYNSDQTVKYGLDYFPTSITVFYEAIKDGETDALTYSYTIPLGTSALVSCAVEKKTNEDTDKIYYLVTYKIKYGATLRDVLNNKDVSLKNISYFEINFANTIKEDGIYLENVKEDGFTINEKTTYLSTEQSLIPTYRDEYKQALATEQRESTSEYVLKIEFVNE